MASDPGHSFPKLSSAFTDNPERFPVATAKQHARLLNALDAVWGTQDAVDHLNGLLFSDRPDRQGFDPAVMAELMSLWALHDHRYPQFSVKGDEEFVITVLPPPREERHGRPDRQRRHNAERAADASAPQRGTAAPMGMEGDFLTAANRLGAEASPLQATAARPDARPAAGGGTGDKNARAEAPCRWPTLHSVADLTKLIDRRNQDGVTPARDGRKLLEIIDTYCQVAPAARAAAFDAHLKSAKKQALGTLLQQMGAVPEEDITRALCLQNGIPIVDLSNFRIAQETMKLVPVDVARLKHAVPLAAVGNVLFLAVENPLLFDERQYFSFLTNHKIEPVMAARDDIAARLADYGQTRNAKETDEEFRCLAQKTLAPPAAPAAEEEDIARAAISQEDATVVGLVNKIILDAADNGASDIHIERFPGNDSVLIRVRRDGRLESYSEYPFAYHDAVISRIKIIAGLDITERRRPQDGKISFPRPGKERLDLRVATLPTLRGIENAVIRVLHVGDPRPIDRMGLTEDGLHRFRRLIRRPHGLMLVCGPTGSGKTTTLHSALQELNTPDRKIWTAEDPVEIVQRNVNQVQVNAKVGLSFANALRSFLRADPDVIMIGELRDAEATKMALEASMTGHLVLSTLHTNSSSDTVARMLDLGADPFNLAGALVGVTAQRLTRQLCSKCKARRVLKPDELEDLAAEFLFSAHQRQPTVVERDAVIAGWKRRIAKRGKLALWQPKGCEVCNGKGYKGRLAIFEILEVTPEIRHLVRTQQGADEILRTAIAAGMSTLKQDGIEKALAGHTCMTEVRGACN